MAEPENSKSVMALIIMDRQPGKWQSSKAGRSGSSKADGSKGAEATANAAAATVKASVEGGKAAAEIAAGTAAGGPWGAILSAAWAMRHTLSRYWYVSVCFCYS